jgi:PKD repeat protein
MNLDGGIYKLSSGVNETHTHFAIYQNANIQARHTTFSQYNHSSASSGIQIYEGARVGTLEGDDDDDFDQCTFNNWYNNGYALTFSNAESFTITEPTFTNSGGWNINQQTSANIFVTGSNTGSRGGEAFDSDPEGGQSNKIRWENTCTLTGKNATGEAVSPSDNETLYYASDFSVSATGDLISGTVLHWILIPPEAGSPSDGDGQNASFTIHQSAEIVWYSGIPGQWTGAVSSQWSDPANWSDHKVPDYTVDVLISGKLNRYPVLNEPLYVHQNNGTIQCRSLTINPFAALTSKSDVIAYSGIYIKGGTWLQESNQDNAIQIKAGGQLKLLGGNLSVGRTDQDHKTDLLIDNGGFFVLEAGDASISDCLFVNGGGTLQMNGGNLFVGQYSGELTQTPHAVFQLDSDARFYLNGGSLYVQSPCCNDPKGLLFDSSATVVSTGGEIVFRSINSELTHIEADFGDHLIYTLRMNMYSSDHQLKLTGDAQFYQLKINKGQFDLNGNTISFDGQGPSITIGDQDGTDDASFVLSGNGTVNVNQSIDDVKALYIQKDGLFLMSGGSFNRNVLNEDDFDAIIHVASGGVFQQTGGQVLIDNQTPENHWGVWVDSGGQFFIHGGEFYNDAATRCYGDMHIFDSTYYVSSSCNENNVDFIIENNARIQAKNATFSRFCSPSISEGIYIKTGASIGETTGDDTDDFDQCRFENWSSVGTAMTVENPESFTMVQPVFENTYGVNIVKESSGQIVVIGQATGSRGGEKHDSDSDGGLANYIDWENTCSITGKSNTARAVSPGSDKTYYYTCGSQVSALGAGIPLSWEITPVNAASVTAGEDSPAEFMLYDDATIIWYSIKPGLWRGLVSSNWNDSGNWDDGNIPDETLDVTIPYTCTYFPVINQSVSCKHLTIKQHAQITVQSMTLTVKGRLSTETNALINNDNGVIKIDGDFLNTGTFNAQTGTVMLSGYSNCEVKDTSSGPLKFNRLIVHKQNNAVITCGNIYIEKELMLVRGAPHFTGTLAYESNAVLTYACQTDQTMGTELNSSTFPSHIHINSPAKIFLPYDIEIGDSLTISSGFLVIGDFDLHIPENAVLSGHFSNTAMIVTNGDGLLIRDISQPEKLGFPIGGITGDSVYAPLTLTFISGEFSNASVSVQAKDKKFIDNPSFSNYVDCYWNVTSSGLSNYSCNVIASMDESLIQGSKDNLYFGRWDGINWFLLDPAQEIPPIFSGKIENFGIFTAGERDFFESRIIISGYLNHFCGVQSGGISEEKYYAVAGYNLLSDIIITPPPNFEISTTSGSGFITSPQTLVIERQQTTVPETQLYVRFIPPIDSEQHTSSFITHTSDRADTKKVTASGSGLFIRTLTLSAPTPTTDIQVKLELNKENFDYSHVLPGGADIRFMKEAQSFPYWIQSWNPEGKSIIWVLILNAGVSSFDMEYGNTELESISNGTDTFEIYDDFVSSSLDPTIWRKENATTTISDGQLLIYSTQSNGGISSVKSFTTTDTYAYEAVFQARILENNTFILFGFSGSTDPWQPRTGIYAYNNLKRFGVQNGAISISHETNNEVALYDEDMTHLFSVSLNQGYHFDDNQVDFEGEPVSTAYAAISTYLNGGNASVDWIFVRKSAVPDIVSTIGAECNMPGGGIWLGNKSSDWSDPENWNSGGVPKNSDNVIIPANVSNMPRLTAISNCKNIEIKRNASLSLSNYQLNIFGEWKNSGAFIPQTGAICFQGNVDIDASGLGPDTTIMGDVAYSQKYTYPSTSYLGYKFKPDKDITIFSFRSFFGTRISLWNASGKLLASMSTGDEQEKWVDYELPEPLPLTGNESYVLATYTGGKPFYLNVDVASEFTDGIIQESRISSGYDYPESLSSAKWWMVDMIYKKGSGSGFENFHRLIIQKPGEYELTVRSAHIENRLTLKSGRFTVTGVLSYSPEAALEYATGDFTTTITEFPKIDGPQNLIINSTGTVTLSSDYTINGRLTMLNGILQLGAQNFILGSDASVVVSTSNNTLIATNGTGSVRQLLSEPRSCIFPVGNMTPTPQYSPLRLDIVSLQFSTPSSIDVRVENVNYPDNAPPLSLDSINRYWSIQSNNITDFQCNLTASYFDSDLPETTVEKSVMGASWDGTAWTELNQVDLGKNTFDGNATNPLIVSAYEYPLDNSLPTSENKSFLIIENGSYAFSQTDFEFYDDDLYDTFKAIRITQSPGAGQLTYQTAPVQTQQIIAVEHIDDLLYTPSLEEYGDNYAYIMFQVQDSDLGWSESSYIVTINVLKQNEAPRISQESPIHITISEDLSPISWFFPTISAIDPDGDNMTWQIAISPQYGNALVQGSGVHPSVVQYTPVENYFGEDQWVISVQDVSQEPLSDTIVVQVEIEDVNDPPLFDCGPKHIVLSEDFASSVIISVTPVTPPENEASQAVNYSLSPVTNSLLNAVINPNNGTVTLSHLPDKNGELYLDILATDHQSQNASASQRIAITVLEENDPPLFHLNQYEFNLQEDFSQTYTVTVFPEVVPSDETSQSVQYYLSPSEIEFVDLSIDSDTGTVNISKVTNGNGTKEISIWADDGQTQHHLYHQSLLIQVAAINDPPIFHLSKSNLRLEQDFQNIEIIEAEIEPVPTDEANQTIAFTLSPASVSFANVDIEPGTGKITISRVPQGIGVETFVVTADDSQNNNYSFTSNFTLEVIPEMPPLSIELSRNLITVYEDFTQIETIQTILESDDYYTERSVAYSLSPSTIDFAQLAINSDTGDITITKIPNGNGIQTIKVLATDLVDPELSSSDIFTLNVLPVNDTPDFTLSENQLEFQENDSTAVIISIQPEPQPQDESAQAVTYSISPMDSNLLSVSIQPLQRTITIVPKTNRNGYQEFDVIAQEQQLENNQVIKPLSVTVIGVNTPPIFELSEQNIQLDEDFSVPFVLTVNPMDQPEDEIGQSVSYSLSPSILTFINMYIDSSTGTVTFESIPNEFGQAAVEISAHEDHVVQNADYSQSFNLSVESINDSPTFRVNKKIVQVPEDFSTTEIITITPDQQPLNERDQLITYRLLPESVDFASIDINETTGAISIQAIKDKNGSEQLNIIADDHAPSNNTASCKIDLIVYPVNDPPDFTLSPTAMTLIEDFTQTQFVQLIPMIKPQDEKGQTVTFKMMPPEIDFADMHIDPVTGEIRIAKIDDKHGFQRFTIKADDLEPQNNIASHYFDLTIISVNDPPLFTLSKTDISVKEGFDTSIIVNAFPETVPDDEINQLVTYYITPQTVDFIDVKIDAETGQLTIQDNEQQKNGSQVFVVTATDHQFQNYFAKVDITISVRPANDPPIFTLSEPTVILTEDFDHPVTVAVISAPIPPDEQDQIITYEIVPDHVDFANLSFNPDTGSLTITHIPNKNGSQTFTFIANDHQLISNTHEQAFFLEVTAVNDPPKMELSRYELRMDEDFTNSETISCVPQSVPQDETAQTVTYRLSPSTCNFADIQIIPDSGLVTINSLPHKNGSGHFDIVADDAQDLNNIYTRSFDLHIIAINDPPEFTLSETQCLLPEDFVEDLHITVKTGHIPEDEQTQMVRYSLEPQSTPFATVNMNSITGEITIRSRPDENGIQTFKVIANDFQSQHQLYEQSFTINVQSENDPPQFTLSRYSIHVDEDFSGSESILVVPGFAPSDETDQIIHYQLSPTSVNFASVSINKDTGVIQIKSTQNGNGSQLFSVIADDGQDINHTCTVQFSVVVEAINDPPRFELTDHELNLVEDFETIHTVFSQLESIPFDERNQDIQFTIETIDPQIADISIDPNSGKLTIQSIENLNGTQVVKVVADDGQRYYSHYEDTLTIYVQSINDPPDFSLNKHEMVLQEDFTETQDIIVFPKQVPLDELNQSITYQIDPEDSSVVQAIIDSTTGTVQILSIANQSGFEQFTIVANDGQSNHHLATSSLAVTVVAVNDPPSFTLRPSYLTVEEGFSGVHRADIVLNTLPWDERYQEIVYRLEPETADLANIWIDQEEKALYIEKIDNNQFGFEQVTVIADDGQLQNPTASQIFSLTLTSVNDQPVAKNLSFYTLEDHAFEGQLTADDPDNDSLIYELTRTPFAGTVSIHPETGIFDYTPDTNISGMDNFTFRVNDGIVISEMAIVTINITPVNDIPMISSLPDQFLMEGIMPEPVSISITDHDAGKITVWVSSSNTNLVSMDGLQILESETLPYVYTLTGTEPHIFHLNITPEPGIENKTTIQVKVVDSSGGEQLETFDIWVEKYRITANYGENGYCVPSGDIPVNTDSTITFGFYPDEGYGIDQLLIDNTGVDTTLYHSGYTFKSIRDDHSLSVSFKRSISIFVNFITTDPREGYAPLSVSFVSQIQGNVSRLLWDFGDGTTSNVSNPLHEYTKPGNHTVRLTAYGSEGSKYIEKTNYILVKSRKIQGHVVGQDSGLGLSGYTVEVWQDDGTLLKSALTDHEGLYVLNELPKANDLIVSAWPPHGKTSYFAQYYRNKEFVQEANILSTVENDLNNIDFFLNRAPDIGIQGCVLAKSDNLNSGIPGIQVDIFSNKTMFGTAVLTNATGCYSVTHLKPSDDYLISVWHEPSGLDYYYAIPDPLHAGLNHPTYSVSRWQKATKVMPSDPLIQKIDIILDPVGNQRGMIKGTVYKSDSTPLPGVWVSAISDSLNDQNSALTDDNGRYTISELTPVSYEDSVEKGYIVEINTDNYPYQAYNKSNARETATLVNTGREDIHFYLSITRTLSGSVTTQCNIPIRSVKIAAWPKSGGQYQETYSDHSGQYAIEQLQPSSAYIVAIFPNNHPVIYYPDKNQLSEAQLLDLSSQNLKDINFSLLPNARLDRIIGIFQVLSGIMDDKDCYPYDMDENGRVELIDALIMLNMID